VTQHVLVREEIIYGFTFAFPVSACSMDAGYNSFEAGNVCRLDEVVDAPSLETFKISLDVALSNLIQLKMPLPMAGGWTR